MKFELIDIVGYVAALFMFSSFYMKKMIPLRIVGICANITFATFAGFTGVWPLFILHIVLFPLNIMRMMQMLKLIKAVKIASKGDLNMDFLVPYMKKESFKAGEIVFKKGDLADKLYFLVSGRVKLKEINASLEAGELIGEIGIFAGDQERMATLECEIDTKFLTIKNDNVKQLYYQNPDFGFFLIQLVIQRLKTQLGILPISDEAHQWLIANRSLRGY
ncbi:MAG: cyclic nucleotide-binding domain-containing protein [Spirochaetota bacterium]|nr:cyclic nucleotide-binding domain-containing protein [Spirochaetota bacterium]